MSRWHDDANDDIHGVVFGEHPCPWDYCPDEHVHVFTDAELRARDERIIRALADRILYDAVRDGDGMLGIGEIVRMAVAETLAAEADQ